ncbi:titin isoform X3 [Condylostylus longicornis]|uniref:titin isoform X3 n=1 Tax=Condylostylus longicornis TaxID=2530218 RepID=UPI00244E22FA|nr:titin isoform X3 [Condylostylus longicornis]
MDVEVDLASIKDEDTLRRMWQQSEDFGRKKEIRQHLYKLRESRLCGYYTEPSTTTTIIPDTAGDFNKKDHFINNNKNCKTTSSNYIIMDGVSLADQSYQSFKNKEIRDSESPTGDGGFVQKAMRNINSNDGVIKPNTSGWNITSSSTVNPDGSGYKNESLATTEGSRKIAGGQHEFAGINQHMEKASHYGDDKNFVKSAAESSNTKLQESTVVGDEKSGRIEKKSSTVVSSSSKSFSQKQTTSGNMGDFDPNLFGIDRPSGQFPAILERRDSTQSNATDYSTRSNTNQSLKEKLAMTRQNVESRSTSSIREEEFHHQTQSKTSSSKTNQQQQIDQQEQQQHRHYEIGGKHHLRETDNYEREHQRYQDELERKLAQEISQQQRHHNEQKSSSTTTEHATSHQQHHQQKILRQSENISREEQQKQHISKQQNTTSAIDGIDERYLTKYTDNTGTTIKKSGVINKDSPPELQAQFEKLKAQPGRIISEEISYPKPGVKMITTKKELSDGTVVTTRDYETKTPNERVVQEKVIAGNTERSQHVKYNTNTEKTDRQFTKSIDQRNQQILRNTDATDSSDRTSSTRNRDVTDHSRVRHDDYVEKIRDAVETLDINKTVKKDLSRTMRDENLTQADFVETDRGCVLIDRNTGRPERYTTSDVCDRNAALREERQEYEYQTKDVRQQKFVREDDTQSTHGFPSQRVPDENRHPGEKIHKIYKDEDGFRGTHGFPSARSPDTKSQYSTSSTTKEHYEQTTRSNQHDEDFRGTHGFPSARTPGDSGDHITRRSDFADQYPQKSTPRDDDFLGTHGFPSTREPSGRYSPSVSSELSEHYEKRTQKTDESFLGTHGFPSARAPDDRPYDRQPTSPGAKSKQPVGPDFRGTHGFPSVAVDKNERQTRVETQQQQFTTQSTVKHVDAAHEAFARSLRCVSPIDNTRRGSNASQRSYRTNTHGSTRSHDSPARERSVLSDSSHVSSGTVTKGTTTRTPTKHHSKEVHHSNETIDLPSKTIHTKTTTTKATSHDATPGFTRYSPTTSPERRSTKTIPNAANKTSPENKSKTSKPIDKGTCMTTSTTTKITTKTIRNESPQNKIDKEQPTKSSYPTDEKRSESPINHEIDDERNLNRNTRSNTSRRITKNIDNTEEIQSNITKKTKSSPTRNQSPSKSPAYDSPKSSRKSSPTKQGPTSREPSPNQKPTSTKKVSTITTKTKTTKGFDDKLRKPERQPSEPEFELDSPGSGYTTSDFEFVRVDDTEVHNTHRTETNFNHSKHSAQPVKKASTSPHESGSKHSPHLTRKTTEKTFETSSKYSPQPVQKFPNKPKDIDFTHSPQLTRKIPSKPHESGSPERNRKFPEDSRQLFEPSRDDSEYGLEPSKGYPEIETGPESSEPTEKPQTDKLYRSDSSYSPQPTRKSPEKTHSKQSPNSTRKSPEKTISTIGSTSTGFTKSQKTDNAIYRDSSPQRRKPSEPSKAYIEDESEPENEPAYHDTTEFIVSETTDTQDGIIESKQTQQKTDTFTRQKKTQEFIDSERFDAEFPQFDREPSPINENIRPRSTSKDYQAEIEKITQTSPGTRKFPQQNDKPEKSDYYKEMQKITNDTTFIDETNVKSSNIVSDHITDEHNRRTYVTRGDIPIEPDDEEEPRQPFFLKEPINVDENVHEPTGSKPKGLDTIATNDTESKNEYPKEIPKSKTPFTRSETFEERCRQMLGISDTSEKTTSKKHQKTTEFITNERRYQDSFLNRKSSSSSPVPSPRSTSPQKMRDSDVKITVTTTENVTKTNFLEKESYSDVDSIKTRSASPSPVRRSKAPTRETSPSQRPDHPEVSLQTVTKKSNTDSLKDTYSSSPYDSPYSRSPDSSPIRRPGTDSAYSRSPDSSPVREHIKTIQTTTVYEKTKPTSKETSPVRSSKTTKTRTTDKEKISLTTNSYEISTQKRNQSPVQPKHITTARIEISPTSVRKTLLEKNTSPTRKPTESRKPYETSPTRKPIDTSPTRRAPISHKPYESSPTRESTKPSKPHDNSPGKTSPRPSPFDSSPTRKTTGPNKREESPLRKSTESTKPYYESPTRKTTESRKQYDEFLTSISEPIEPNFETPIKIHTEPLKPLDNSTTAQLHEMRRPRYESPTRKSTEQTSTTRNKLHEVTKGTTSITSSRIINKGPSPSKDSPRKPKEKEIATKPTIRKKIVKRESLTTDKITRGDIEVDESDVLSDDENILIIETTSKVTDTKKSTPAKKYPVTERKESAPVSRTTQIDRDTKFTRSTSDNIFKTSATKRTLNRSNETPNKTKPVESPKLVKKQPSDQKRDKNEKRPSKCLTTKTINLTTANNILNSEEMENVVIDIQQAKSSREPSPNKIVPVPVSASADDDHDGFPRYPDEVQEPEDSRRTPKVRNIPIFQESLNDFVGCQITEIKETDDCIINERRQQNINVTEEDNFTKNSKMRDTIRTSATIVDDKVDENCLLSVHEKVHKFINTAEEIKKPKTSSPFKRDLQEKEQYPVDDECLLSVNDKVNKFLSTAEKVTKDVITSSGKRVVQRLNVDEIDENLRNDECVLSVSEKVNKFINTAERLVESVPQKSPNLVAQIDRQISKQSEDERNFEPIKKQPYEPVATYIPNGSPYDHEDYSKTKKGEPKYPRDRSTSPITKPQKSKPSQPRGSLISNEITVNKTVTQKSKVTDRYAPNKPKEITRTTSKPVIKTTETVRKAKSVFENGDVKTTSRTTTSTSNNSKQRDIISRPSVFEAKRNREPSDVKLKDIGVRKTTKENDLNRPEPKLKDDRPHKTKPVSSFQSTKNSVTDSVSSRKNVFEQCTILSTNDIGSAALEVTERLSKSTPRRKSGAESPTRRTVPESPHRRQPSAEYSRKPAIVTEATVTTSTRKVQSPAKFNNAEDTDGYVDKSKTTSQKKVPLLSKSPTRDGQDSPIPATKKVFESNTEYIDEYTDKYQKVEKNHYSRKDSSSTISTKKISDKNEQYDTDTMVSRKPTDSILSDLSPQGIKPVREETFTTTTTTTRRGDESPSVLARKNIFESPDVKLNGYSSPIQKPSYMDHTKSSLEHIRRDSLEINRTNYQRKTSFDEETFENNPKSAVKFGVHLKHNASEYKPRRKSSSSEIPHIEEIFDLELLEQMLSTVVGYEQRRRIRSQIRIVKKLIEQKKREETQIAYIRETSPARRSTPSSPRSPSPTIRVTTRRREDITKKSEEEQVAYIRETSPARKSPVREQTQNTPRRDATKKSPVRNATKTTSIHDGRQTSPVRESRVERTSHKEKYSKGSSNTNFIDHESKHIEKHESYTRERSISPKSKVKTVTTITEIRKVGGSNIPDKSITTKKVVQSNTNEKPIWATKNILKKASESDRSAKVGTTKKIQSSSTTRTSHTQQKDKKVSDEDVITSSYGIGPTDEDGRPLFGLRALKTKKPAESSKVTGTIVSESFYSENGHAPVGERKITVYSTDPNDIDEYEANYDNKTRSDSIKRESCQRDGLTSVTRTQKFGDGNKFDTRDVESLNDTIEFDGSTKVRRGSVKEMSEKFIRKESSSSVTEKTSSSSYPKAGLILRTKTKESSPTTSRYRAGSYEDEEYESAGHEYESSTTRHESKTRSIHESESETESIKISKAKSSTSTRSFLDSSGSKVTGVNDVLERMRNADNIVQDGDSMEDREARALLNKFLGASVLMSGVESMMPAQEVVTTRVTKINTEPVKEVVKTTRVTKTVKSEGNSSTPVSFGTSDIEEVWDEEYLKELLEQSTSYEERRKIRARIKQLMAEREGKNSAPNSPHHFITSPVHNWAGVKRSTPTSPMTSALPWVSKNRTENRIRSKAEKYDKKSPPPSNLHRQTSLHHQDNAFDQRKKDYGTNLTDMKRPSLPDANDPYIKSSYNAQPTYYASTPHIHNNSHSYEYDNQANQKPEPLIQYQNAQKLHKSQPALEYNPPITDQDYGIMPVSVPVHNEIQEYTPKFRNREDSLTNPNAQPLVLTSSCPTFDPQNTISENHKPLILTNTCSTYDPQNTISESHKYPLKIFDYPSPTTSMASPISYPHHDITTDDEVDSEILTEYKVESKVMTGPVSQQAVTVSANKTQRIGDNGKKSAVAKSLLSTMKNIKAEDRNKGQKQILPQKQIPTPEVCLSPDGRSYQAPQVEPVFPELTKVETNRAPEYLGQPFASQTPSHYQQNPVYVPPQSNLIYNSAETDYQQTLQYQQQLQQNLSQEKKQKEYQEQLQKLEQHQYEEHKQKLEQERLQKEYEKHKKILEQQRLQKEYEEHKKLMEQQRLQKEYEEHKKMLEQQRLQQEYEEHKRLLHQQQIQKEYEQQQIVEQHKIELQKQQQLKNMNSNQQKLQSGNHQYQPSALNNTANGNLYQYSDIQKNLEQHRQIQEAYPKQEQQNFQQYKPTPPARKKSAPKVEPTTPVLNAKSTVPPKFGYSDLKPIKNYSDVSNFAEKSQSVSKSSKIETFNENQKHEIHSSQQTTKQQALKARQRSLEEPTVDEQQNQIILSQKKISSNTEIIKQKAQKKIATQQEIYQTNKKLITEVQEENKGNFTKIVSQKNQQVVEKVEYKSSQPADTPDIVKSSLPKDDIPILKKFGPPQRHLYTPNAYKTPITKCESASNASKMSSTTTSTGRKMSEPSVLAKLQKQQSQPEIIETPATPAAEQEENIEEIIPRNIVFNNVAQFTNMSRRVSESASDQLFNKNIASVKTNNLSKSDSWHQICMLQHQTKPPSPKFGESGVGNQLRRTKSGHTLAVPKMYEGSINRDEVSEKQNIVAAYFSGNKSPNSLSRNSSQTNITDNEKMSLSSSMTSSTFVKKSSINRTRTVDKTSIGKQMPSTGLVRSQTMPHIDKLNLLDESNVEDAFEQILLGS